MRVANFENLIWQRNLGHGSEFRSFSTGTSSVATASSQPLSGFGTGLELYNYTYSNWNKIWTSPTGGLNASARPPNHLTNNLASTGNNLNSLNNLTNNLNGGLHSTNPSNNPGNSPQTNLLSSNYLPATTLRPAISSSSGVTTGNISSSLPNLTTNGSAGVSDSLSLVANGSSSHNGEDRNAVGPPIKKEPCDRQS